MAAGQTRIAANRNVPQRSAIIRLSEGKRRRLLIPVGEAVAHQQRLECAADGIVVARLVSPRPIRLSVDGVMALDEPLNWRDFQRRAHAAAIFPVRAGATELRWMFGERPHHPQHLDVECPSRNRARVMRALARAIPDRVEIELEWRAGQLTGALSLRFTPQQFIRDGLIWQCVWVRQFPEVGARPDTARRPGELPSGAAWRIEASDWAGFCHEAAETAALTASGPRQMFVPVGDVAGQPRVRAPGEDERIEPALEVVGERALVVEFPAQRVGVAMPVFESVGRLAPRREFAAQPYPNPDDALARLPQPVLPDALAELRRLYEAAWRMLFRLARVPRPESGLPGPYIGTGAGFTYYQFVWDTSFAAMATAYGWRALPPYDSLNVLYSRQQDGGYIHREIDVRDGLPALYEPDFGPNPPVMAVAEWAIYRLSGNLDRLRRVYGALAEHHAWITAHRRLPNGVFWTTGLANGLDNSPSLGEGYPCLTAQMAHHAEMLARMADELGCPAEALRWRRERRRIAAALNRVLWNPEIGFYCTSLAGGGHNPNKIITGFWPLWADAVPRERVSDLVRHAQDPASFWRPHPLPSLAADSPHYRPGGDYWLGSVWAPTNFAAIQGFARAGHWELARAITERHLRAMLAVLDRTGAIWENYSAEEFAPGSSSGRDYCWSAAGPVALLYEILIGLQPDAPRRTLRWRLPETAGRWGAQRYPLGPCTIHLLADVAEDVARIRVQTDYPFDLEIETADGECHRRSCAAGETRLEISPLRQAL